MANIQHRVLTLTGVAQALIEAWPVQTTPGNRVGGPDDKACRYIDLQSDPANAGAIFVGGPGVTTTNYGVRIPVPVTNIPELPYRIDATGSGGVKPSTVYVIGTSGQLLHILILEW